MQTKVPLGTCPWCGEPVYLGHIGPSYGRSYYVTCRNYKCPRPGDQWYDTAEEAEEKWKSGETVKEIKEIFNET